MRLLLHHKAAVDHKDKLGRTALDHTQNEFQSDGIKAVVRLLENAIKHTNHAHSKRKSTSSFEQNVEQLAKPAEALVRQLHGACREVEAEMDAGVVDRRTGGPKLGLDPNGRYIVPASTPLYMTKDALGRNVFASPW